MAKHEVKVYYDNPVETGILTQGYVYTGPGKAYRADGTYYTNVFVATPNNWLLREKRGASADFTNVYTAKYDGYVNAGETYTNLAIRFNHLDWVATPAPPTVPGRLSGITVGFATDIWATEIRLIIEFSLENNIAETLTITVNVTNDSPEFVYDLTKNRTVRSLYASGYVIKDITVYTRQFNITGYPVISYFLPYLVKTYNVENGLKEFVRGQQSTADNNIPRYGVVASYGKVVLQDVDSNIEYISQIGAFKQRQKVKIILDNLVIGVYVSEKWDYDSADGLVTISLTDDLVDLQNIPWKSFKITRSLTAFNIAQQFLSGDILLDRALVGEKYVLGTTTMASVRLLAITVNDFHLEEGSKWDFLNKFCQLCGLTMYKTGREVIRTSGGNRLLVQQVYISSVEDRGNYGTSDILIDPDLTMDAPKKTIINQNYITGVAYDQLQILPATGNTTIERNVSLFSLKTNTPVSSLNMLNNYAALGQLFNYGIGMQEDDGLPMSPDFITWNSSFWTGYVRSGSAGEGYKWNNLLNVGYMGSKYAYVKADKLIRSTDIYKLRAELVINGQYIMETYDNNTLNPDNVQDETNYYPYKPTTTVYSYDIDTGKIRLQYNMTPSGTVAPFWIQFLGSSSAPNQNLNGITWISGYNFKVIGYFMESEYKSFLYGVSDSLYNLETNEMMSNTSTLLSGGIHHNICEYWSKFILNGYINGRQTATLTCRYGEYWELESGGSVAVYFNGVDGWHPQCDNVVIPRVLSGGDLVPLSKNPNGTPKKFVVTSSEMVFDGETLIHLNLIEVIR